MRYILLIAFRFLVLVGCTKPKIGEIWRFTPYNSDDPFGNDGLRPYYDYKVVDIQGDYIKYMDISDSSFGSYKIKIFVSSFDKIKNCNCK